MAFRMTTATAFAHGAWNIYILQPSWLDKKGVFVSERPVKVETLTTGPGFRLSAGPKSPRWVATPFLVRVEFDSPAADELVGGPLGRLLAALPETPVRLVGFELVYQSNKPEDMQAVPRPAAAGEPGIRYGASISVTRGGVNYYLDLSYAGPDEPAQLFAVCDQPPGGDLLTAFPQHSEAVRDIAGQYWQVAIS